MRKYIWIAYGIVFTWLIINQNVLSAGTDDLVNFEKTLQRTDTSEDRQVSLLFDRAEEFYLRSLNSADEGDIYGSIESLEELINRYPDSIGARNAYFLIADLLSKKIQGKDGNNGAILAYQDYLSRYGLYENAWRAQYNIASIQYLYLKDYEAAGISIEKLFEEHALALENKDDNLMEAKLLLSKIMHKNGKYNEELKALDEIELIDYKMDFSYTGELVQGIKPNRILDDGIDKFIFMGSFDKDFPVKRLVNKFRQAEASIKKRLSGIERDFPLEIFVYTDAEYFQRTTDRTGSFGSGADAQIFHLAGQPIEPVIAQVYAFILNSQPSRLRVNFLEVGFINAFGEGDIDKDTAALELGISEKSFKGELLLDNGEFPFISEGVAISGAFVNYLLDNYPPQFFHTIFKMLEGSIKSQLKIAGGETAGFRIEDSWVDPQTLMMAVEKIYSVSFTELADGFLNEMRAHRSALDAKLDRYWASNPPEKFKVDNSTPEGVLTSYFKSIQAGDYDNLRNCTSGELRNILDEACKFYTNGKILDKVERWKMAIPYIGVNIEVINREVFTDSIVVFKVNLIKDGKLMEQKDLVALNEKGKWYISEN
ncbi:MAG: hypothetical protein ABIG42_02750 [bacterium]